nr:hypothetical protein [Psychrobacter sp. PraFG1]
MSTASGERMKYIDVAVAVIHYQEKYLLGYRGSHQHQGIAMNLWG